MEAPELVVICVIKSNSHGSGCREHSGGFHEGSPCVFCFWFVFHSWLFFFFNSPWQRGVEGSTCWGWLSFGARPAGFFSPFSLVFRVLGGADPTGAGV